MTDLSEIEPSTPEWEFEEWAARGVCGFYVSQGRDKDWWFSEDNRDREPISRERERKAKSICNRECPVVAECRAFALANPEVAYVGVWGGLDHRQLQAARRTKNLDLSGFLEGARRARAARQPLPMRYVGPCWECGAPMVAGREVVLPSPEFRKMGSKRHGLCSRCKEAHRRHAAKEAAS